MCQLFNPGIKFIIIDLYMRRLTECYVSVSCQRYQLMQDMSVDAELFQEKLL